MDHFKQLIKKIFDEQPAIVIDGINEYKEYFVRVEFISGEVIDFEEMIIMCREVQEHYGNLEINIGSFVLDQGFYIEFIKPA